jgi:hypothetical protein
MGEQRWHVSPQVVYQELEGEVVLVHLGTNRIFQLNATGAACWQMIAAGRSRASILDQLERDFSVERNQASSEFDELIQSLAGEQLLVTGESET